MLVKVNVRIIINWAQLGVCSLVGIHAFFLFIAMAIESKS